MYVTNDSSYKETIFNEGGIFMIAQAHSFNEIFTQNKRRIHYQIQKLNIHDPHQDFFQEGLVALWNAYETHQPDKGPMATYFNYTIRNRLIDKIRKEFRYTQNNDKLVQNHKIVSESGNSYSRRDTNYPLFDSDGINIEDDYIWKRLKENLTSNQWKWIEYFILKEMSIKEIAQQENKSEDAVKSWGQQVRKKLRDKDFRIKIGLDE